MPTAMPLEGQARALLRSHSGDGLETWLAAQRWRAALDGSWWVEPDRDGWTYRVEALPGEAGGSSNGHPEPAPSLPG